MVDPAKRTAEDVCKIILALRTFNLFSDHEEKMNIKEKVMIALNVSCKEFKSFDAICRIKEPSNLVFFVIRGEIAVTLANPKIFSEEKLDGAIITKYKQGYSFGEIGIISNTTR